MIGIPSPIAAFVDDVAHFARLWRSDSEPFVRHVSRHTLGELVYATIGWVHLGMDRTCIPIVAEVPA